jgi:hypothetical protein
VVLQAPLNPQVCVPSYIDSSGTFADISDKSGTFINDINGVQWLAVYRIGILISQTASSGNTLVFIKYGQRATAYTRGTTPAIAYSNPNSNLFLPIVGDITAIATSGSNMSGLISEIYSVLPVQLLT